MFDAEWMRQLEEKLKAKGKSLEDVLFDDSAQLIKGKSQVDEQAKQQYIKAVELVSKWFMEGKCFFSFDDPEKKYCIHAINIKWRMDEDWVELEGKELKEMFSQLNGNLIIDKADWQVSTTIYHKA